MLPQLMQVPYICVICAIPLAARSLSAVVDNRIFCVHGGLSPTITTLDQVRGKSILDSLKPTALYPQFRQREGVPSEAVVGPGLKQQCSCIRQQARTLCASMGSGQCQRQGTSDGAVLRLSQFRTHSSSWQFSEIAGPNGEHTPSTRIQGILQFLGTQLMLMDKHGVTREQVCIAPCS